MPTAGFNIQVSHPPVRLANFSPEGDPDRVLGIIYPRSETEAGDDNFDQLRVNEPLAYTALVARCVAVGVQLGCNLTKTKYTGTTDTFSSVCVVASNEAILIAEGEHRPVQQALAMAADAIRAGASGVSFGRNVLLERAKAGS